MECSGPQDSRELLQSSQNGPGKGQKAAPRLSLSFRLGKLGSSLCVLGSALGDSCPFWVTYYSSTTDNPTELRPKSATGGQLNESIFLLRYVKPSCEKSEDGCRHPGGRLLEIEDGVGTTCHLHSTVNCCPGVSKFCIYF